MARRYRFRYYPGVRDALSTAPPEARHAFGELLRILETHPFPNESLVGVLEYKETDLRGAYTVPFGETNLLLFQVMADYPLIRLIDVIIA